MSAEHGRRDDDGRGWIKEYLPKAIELIIAIAIVYGSVNATLSYMKNDVAETKTEVKCLTLKVNTLETKFDYITQQLEKIDRKVSK